MSASQSASSHAVGRGGGTTRIIAAAMVGNALEWYDLVIYGVMAITIAKVFFPTGNEWTSLLVALGSFGVSYVMRPFGAIAIGFYADRFGRRAGMIMTLLLMGVGTAVMACTPSYAAMGLAAAIVVVCGRLLQGFSAGGEFATSVAFLAEHAPQNRRAYIASYQVVGVGLAIGLASSAGIVLNSLLTPTQITEWGWRLPFIFGLLIVPLGYWIRKRVEETPVFLSTDKVSEQAYATDLMSAKARMVVAIGLYSLAASSGYLLGVYIPTYAMRQLHLSPLVSFWGALSFAVLQMLTAPVAGALSDRFGSRIFIITGALLIAICSYPAFYLMLTYPTPLVYVGCLAVLAILVTTYQGPMPSFLSELFPSTVRTTSLGLVQNLNFAIFGGFAPAICTWLIGITGSAYIPAYYVTATAVLGLLCILCFRNQLSRLGQAAKPSPIAALSS